MQDSGCKIQDKDEENHSSCIMRHASSISTKKYIIIQNGCDNFCTFCLTIQKRGKHESREIVEIVEEIRRFEKSG
jgi:tRNA A37 methylthiotransferase MiaB